ncbi:iron uptake system component EfeO [Jatrophihabitans sp. GAS493]|uniref:EfeM/EfeO family lipoprotein n=1 Tax=Jatrophihabitans sp. GAS493 TaxID=1907575 RepID=UPI000BB6E0DE|nr:EfeM/EfeO family lipoprotein [Jatrophihabitans sp. GAS493]SOD71688.1 iron uptake system component EfeO [Jatrophihabitans sp. GAS493]
MLRRICLLALVVAAGPLAGCSGKKAADAGRPPITVNVSVGECGSGWSDPQPGPQQFLLHNTDTRAGEVLLTDAKSGAVFADVEPVGPGTSTALNIDLGSGGYAFRCAMEDESTVTGATVTVPGDVKRPVEPVAAVAQGDLIEATKGYEQYVSGQLPKLISLTDALAADIARGNLPAARAAWLSAHLEYERLGAAYGAFGDLDAAINGLPNGLSKGTADPDWTGFHRLEFGLWHAATAASLNPTATRLRSDVDELRQTFAAAQIDPLELSIRAHEITENALQFELTGETDFGSGSTLATVAANLEGTATVLQIIRPLLVPRYRQLSTLTAALAASARDVTQLRDGTGWPPLGALSTPQRELVDSDLSQLSELLAPVASILEPRRPS